MKLVPSRPVTILAVRHAQRWFPYMFRHTDGSLLLYIEHGYDAHFSPCHRLRSIDGGRTWIEEEENVPRTSWAHSFADGELFEIDTYGVLDPQTPDTYCYYGAWSIPGSANREVQHDLVRVHAPSCGPVSVAQLTAAGGGYPTFPWWPLFNKLHGREEVSGDEIMLGGPYFTSGLEYDGRLLALGYWSHRDDMMIDGRLSLSVNSVFCLESQDRGHTWREMAMVARGTPSTPEGFNEATLVPLRDGQLYCVYRSGNFLFHAWSSDGGQSWTPPAQLRLIDSEHQPRMVWPVCKVLEDGTLVLVYGRPGKHVIFDPSGTGRQWQGHLDLQAWELETQELMGVPEELRLHGPTEVGTRYWDSGDYLALVPVGAREMLVAYDVQNYHEHWNAIPISGVRLVRVRLED